MLLLFILAGLVVGSIIGNGEGAITGAVIGGILRYLQIVRIRLAHLENVVAKQQLDHVTPNEPSALNEKNQPTLQAGHLPPSQVTAPSNQAKSIFTEPTSPLSSNIDSQEVPVPEHIAATIDSTQGTTNRVKPTALFEQHSPTTKESINPFSRVYSALLHSNPILRVGVILIFMGTAFLLKYAASYFTLSIEWRIGLVISLSIAMLIFGLRVRHKNRQYGLIIQGAASGLFYLTIFTALARYELISTTIAFCLLVASVFITIGLSLYQNAKTLAIFSIIGGFAAPFLASTGSSHHIILLSYYLVLNTIVLSIAWFQAWRIVNLIGFFFTFSVLSGWILFNYSDAHLVSILLFSIAFFTLYFVVSILFSIKQRTPQVGLIDSTLIFGNPTIMIGNLAIILHPFEYGLAGSFLFFGALYGTACRITKRHTFQQLQLLNDAFYVISLICFTLSIPFIFQSKLISASAWALEGAAILWIALRQQQRFSMFFSALLQIIASVLMIRIMLSNPEFNS